MMAHKNRHTPPYNMLHMKPSHPLKCEYIYERSLRMIYRLKFQNWIRILYSPWLLPRTPKR